jgi:hypothetical protein
LRALICNTICIVIIMILWHKRFLIKITALAICFTRSAFLSIMHLFFSVCLDPSYMRPQKGRFHKHSSRVRNGYG